ncbi:hypothetical protein KY290_027792 [Solanum tuberosum]|uniref:DUF4218 domain-containing protein n=1 Tax=Solanum tuberosum TaxID=4113 RepID=A0ABQ7UG20_SOLTU|nr:hypothetical protein KY290_027792 [Solanum tuberosum]
MAETLISFNLHLKHQGEKEVINEISSGQDIHGSAQPELGYDNPYRQIVLDAYGPNFLQGSSWQSFNNIEPESSHPCEPSMDEDPNPESQKLYDLLQAADKKLYPGASLSQLAVASRMYLGTLKRMIGNKASVEGSICEAYLMTESTQLFSHYFEPHVMTRDHNVGRNDDGGVVEDLEGNLSIFSHPGRLWGEAKKRDLSLEEIKAAQTYILLNCEEVEPFVSMFMQRLQEEFPNLSQGQLDESLEANFSTWFKEFVKPRNVIELPDEEVATISEMNVPFQVEEVEVHEIDMRVFIDENIPLNDPNGDVMEMDEPIDDGLLQEHHEIQIESTDDEYESEETEEDEDEDEDEEFEEDIDSMARGRGRGKSLGRSNLAIHVSMPTIPMPTIVSPNQGGTPIIDASAQINTPTISETPPVTQNQSNPIAQDLSTQSIPTCHGNPTAEGGISTQSNPTGHRNTIAEGDSSSSHTRTHIFLTSAGLEPSITCSSFITKSFRSEVDPNGINWRSVSNDVKDGYFGEFKKKFYWDVSISESEVKRHWLAKAAIKYKNFISKIKGGGIRPGYVPEHVWEKWMQLWGTDESIKKSETNSKNRRGGHEVAAGTHTGGSISIGEYRKRLAIKKGRDPTPAELHLHVHTHGHDGKSFVDERSRIVHETYEEILQEKTASQSDIDQSEAYYQAAGGEKKRRIYGLGSEAKNYYKHKLCGSSSVRPSVSQSASTTNMDEFVKEMLPALTNHFLPVIMERVQEMITPVDNPSPLTPIVPPPATTNEVDPLVSSDDDSIP